MGDIVEHKKAIATIIKKEQFCSIIDSIETYWETLRKLNEVLDANMVESKLATFANEVRVFISDLFYEEERDSIGDEIQYYMWELDFGRKWKPNSVTVDGESIRLTNSEELWDYITKYEFCDSQVIEI